MEGALRLREAHRDHGSDSARTPGGVRCDVVCGHVLDQLHLGSLATLSMISRRIGVIVEALSDLAKPS